MAYNNEDPNNPDNPDNGGGSPDPQSEEHRAKLRDAWACRKAGA